MGRAKRLVTDDGNLYCTQCQSWVNIRNFRTQPVDEETLPNDIWYVDPENERMFGKPDGYCRKCYSKRQAGSTAIRKYQIELGLDPDNLKDRWEAEQEHLDEQSYQRLLKRAQDPEWIAQENARLEALIPKAPDNRIHDIVKAETKAYIERARRNFAEAEAAAAMELSRNGADQPVES